MKKPEIPLGHLSATEMRELINNFVAYADYLEKESARVNIALSDDDFDDIMSDHLLRKVPKTTTTGAEGVYATAYVEWLEQRVKALSDKETT